MLLEELFTQHSFSGLGKLRVGGHKGHGGMGQGIGMFLPIFSNMTTNQPGQTQQRQQKLLQNSKIIKWPLQDYIKPKI